MLLLKPVHEEHITNEKSDATKTQPEKQFFF